MPDLRDTLSHNEHAMSRDKRNNFVFMTRLKMSAAFKDISEFSTEPQRSVNT